MPAQYYFDELDPASFQRLINSLLVKRYGEGVRLLPLRGADGGRDAETPAGSTYYTVTIPRAASHVAQSAIRAGRYLFQVKHHRLADRAATTARAAVIQDFGEELTANVLTRTDEDEVNYFFLITNVPSTKEAFAKVDEKRRDVLRSRNGLHAEVLWQDHITAWLDHTPSTWAAFPEIFAGRLIPILGQIAAKPDPGLSLSLRLAISTQMKRDSVIRFRQINLEQRLARLFVDLDARSTEPHRFYVHTEFLELEEMHIIDDSFSSHVGMRVNRPGAIPLLTSEANRGLSKIILEGGPGQGKSTVTQMLAQIYRSLLVNPSSEYAGYWPNVRRARFPIRVELRLFAEWLADTNKSVEQYLAETFSVDAGGAAISVEDVQNAVSKQDVLLIFDGLDEVGSDVLRDQVVAKLVECVTRLETAVGSDLRVIVTSRPPAIAGRLDALSGFRRLQLQPLDDEKVNEYLTRWTQVQCTDAADRERVAGSFLKRKTEAHVAALVKNPMQLSVLLHFIRLKGEAFPDKRAELYREYFKTVIDRDVEKSPELRRNRDDIETLHEVIGFTIHSRAEGVSAASRLTRPDLIMLVRKWFETEGRNPELGESLFAIGEERLGLIVALSGEGEATQYGFEIQPVREYFAAAFINDKCEANAHDLFEQMMRRPFWREVARFLAGLRRANERADILSRARQLDQDSVNGWRSDGLAIVLQLLQEGVLSTPGHVHREALSFVIASLDANNKAARVQPDKLVSLLPKLIASCDSEQPRVELKALLKQATTWGDRHDLKRLWSVCNRTFSETVLCAAMAEYAGDRRLKAEMEIRWPVEAGNLTVATLESSGELTQFSPRVKNEQLFFATASDASLRSSIKGGANHRALVEEFAFQGVFGYEPLETGGSPLAVWQLCEWLHRAGVTMRNRKVMESPDYAALQLDGLDNALAMFIKETVERLKAVTQAGGTNRSGAATRELLRGLISTGEAGGIESLVAIRCATTLLGYVEGPLRVLTHGGKAVWAHVRPGSSGRRTEAWQELRKALVPFFGAAFPNETDSAGRTVASQLVERGWYRALQSHIRIEGEWVELLSVLRRYREGDGGPEWLDRMPVQQYWLQTYLKKGNVGSTLSVLSESRLGRMSPVIPLGQAQIGWLAEHVRNSQDFEHGTEVLFATHHSNLWGRFRYRTLKTVLSCASPLSSKGMFLFERDEYSQQNVPEIVADMAAAIIAGEIKTTSAITAAAAHFMSERRADKLPPLREMDLLPQSARAWYDS